MRHFNIPPPTPSSFHPNAPGILSHSAAAAAAACMHPAFNYIFARPETMSKSSLINHQTNYFNLYQQQSTQNRDISALSSCSNAGSGFCQK